MKKCIILDSDHAEAIENRIFEKHEVEEGYGDCMFRHLAREAQKAGFDMVTADVYLRSTDYSRAYCISNMQSQWTERLLDKGARAAICFAMEPPIIAKRFYFNMKKLSGRFLHSYQFEGSRGRIDASASTFHRMHYPICRPPEIGAVPFEEKEFLVLINSNKRAMEFKRLSLSAMMSRLKFRFLPMIDPLLRGKELYVDRIRAIRHFSSIDGFSLYGFRWNDPIPGFDQRYSKAAKKVYRGVIDRAWEAKLKVLAEHRFCICFENFRFDGYVTEKIMDCLIARCVPVYYGAPDIDTYVPKEAYIDFSAFSGFDDLHRFLNGMGEQRYAAYLEAGRDYLDSPRFRSFSASRIAEEMVGLIVAEDQGAG